MFFRKSSLALVIGTGLIIQPLPSVAESLTQTLTETSITPAVEKKDIQSDTISVNAPYAFTTGKSTMSGAVFLELQNTGETNDALLSFTGDVAQTLEIHDMTMEDGVMRMRKMDKLPLPAGETVILEPTGKHLMLIGLNSPLATGESFPLTLNFEKSGTINIDVTIKDRGTAPKDHKKTDKMKESDHQGHEQNHHHGHDH